MLNLAVVVPFITAYSQRIQDLAKGGRHRVYCPSPDAEVGVGGGAVDSGGALADPGV